MRKVQCDTCRVRERCVMRDLPDEALADIRALGEVAIYKPRQVVFSEGNECGGLYLVCEGALKLYHSDRFGRDHILEIAGPGAALGELVADGDAPVSVSAEALTEAQVCFLPRARLATLLQRYPQTGLRLIEALSRELGIARRKARDLALKGAKSRLAGLLVELAQGSDDPSPDRVQLPYTRRDLAEMIGVSPETGIRLLKKLKDSDLITVNGRSILIRDMDKLTSIATHDETEV